MLYYSSLHLHLLKNAVRPWDWIFSHLWAVKGGVTQKFSSIIHSTRIINYCKFRENVTE